MIHDQLHRVYTLHPTNLTRSRPDTVLIPTLLGPDDAIQAPSFIFEKILVLGRLVDASVP